MRKIRMVLFLFFYFTVSHSQIVKGTVHDKFTDSVISFASIYFSGTFVGTYSDLNGYFELDVSRSNSMPLVISALGYYSVTLRNYSSENIYNIYLEPKVFELKEVVITADSKIRKANLGIFRNEFLGTSINSVNCKISNENDIAFNYDPDNETLKAFSSKPILINNRSLGYKITYYLDKFEFCTRNKALIMTGYYIFKDDSTASRTQIHRFDKKRTRAYLGSRMHFLRAFWGNMLDSNGFKIDTRAGSLLVNTGHSMITGDVVVIGNNTKYLKGPGNLLVSYYTKMPTSVLEIIYDSVYFDRNGYFDPLGIHWGGEMSKQRLADQLPYEYSLLNRRR